jgi:hypothetical protein
MSTENPNQSLTKQTFNTTKWPNHIKSFQTFDSIPSTQLASLTLPQLRATEISPRFQNSVGKTLKDQQLKKKAEEEMQTQERLRMKNRTEIKGLNSLSRHENVIVESNQEYQKRILDAEGNWTINMGRMLDTDEQMVLKDYGKTKFF